jgi:hypothetical protein
MDGPSDPPGGVPEPAFEGRVRCIRHTAALLTTLAIPTALREFVPAGRPQAGGAEALAWAARVALVTLVVALALEAATDGAAR